MADLVVAKLEKAIDKGKPALVELVMSGGIVGEVAIMSVEPIEGDTPADIAQRVYEAAESDAETRHATTQYAAILKTTTNRVLHRFAFNIAIEAKDGEEQKLTEQNALVLVCSQLMRHAERGNDQLLRMAQTQSNAIGQLTTVSEKLLTTLGAQAADARRHIADVEMTKVARAEIESEDSFRKDISSKVDFLLALIHDKVMGGKAEEPKAPPNGAAALPEAPKG